MTNYKYIVKKLTPWMMDELIAFADQKKYDLILLREPEPFYHNRLKELGDKEITIYVKPRSYHNLPKKFIFLVVFFLGNLKRFFPGYNAVIGIKSMVWFLLMDMKLFNPQSNMHAQFATQAPLVSLLIKKYLKDQPKVSFTYHAYDIYFPNSWFNLLVEQGFKAFSISEFNIKYIREHYQYSEKIKLSRLGVFREAIQPVKNKGELFTVGLMSWFIEKKGIRFLLEALKNLKNKDLNKWRFVLAGDGPLKQEILNFIEENELQDNVSYLGKLKGEEKEEFYKSLDAFVLPSINLGNDQDGIPVVLMEAVAYGLPIISTNISGIPEICHNEYNGYLINERNVSEIEGALINLIQEPEKQKTYASNSLKISVEYDIRINSKEKMKMLEWR